MASQYGSFGYRRTTEELVKANWRMGKDRVERIWRCEGLKFPQKQKPRGRPWLNDRSCVRLGPERPIHVWSSEALRIWATSCTTKRISGSAFANRNWNSQRKSSR